MALHLSDDEGVANPNPQNTFEEVLQRRFGRRAMMGGSLAAAVGFMAATAIPAEALTTLAKSADNGQGKDKDHGKDKGKPGGRGLIRFTPIPLDSGPKPTISPDYEMQVLIPWGTPLQSSGPAFQWPLTSAADQEAQIGIGHDGMWFFPDHRRPNSAGYLALNHEYGTTLHVLNKEVPESLEDVRIMQAAHGNSVIKIARGKDGVWGPVDDRANRRITVNTPVEFSGPAAGSPHLANAAGNQPAGTLNNCANGHTPWGTYLTCEENFNFYFGANDETWTPNEAQERYGLSGVQGPFSYGWHLFDPRFDLSNPDYANEPNRFGWIVEYDPANPDAPPVKRTALGRVKHEGCALTIGKNNRAVAYMGDDQRFDYIYKFVSSGNYRKMLKAGKSPLDEGTLYAARFNDDGTGDWLELSMNVPALAEQFSSLDELLINTRLAADTVGATPMDRPEWTTVAPNRMVYCTLTNNTRRTEPNAANPLAPNPNGHIIRWKDANKHVGTTFTWDFFAIADESMNTDHSYGSPDGLWADQAGRLFIETDGDQPGDANNQMLVADTKTKEIRRFFTSVPGAEVTGIAATPNQQTMFINIQHPGNGDATLTRFPDYDPNLPPRDATIVITRKKGGVVGS